LTVQQIYRAWELGWLVVVIALVSTLVLTIMVRKKPKVFVLTLVALICIIGTLPANWSELRNQWEYSHAISAILILTARTALILSVLSNYLNHR
jgi:CHASE2 domain-containing sensor protein